MDAVGEKLIYQYKAEPAPRRSYRKGLGASELLVDRAANRVRAASSAGLSQGWALLRRRQWCAGLKGRTGPRGQ